MNKAMVMPVEPVTVPRRTRSVKNKTPSMVQTGTRQVRNIPRARAATNVTKVTNDKKVQRQKMLEQRLLILQELQIPQHLQ